MNKIFILSILFLYIFSSESVPQNLQIEKSLTINDGLSQNSAFAIIQDRKGFIWIGTKDGLNRFDGIGFQVYRHSPDKNTLVNNHVKCLHEDSDGNIWIGTYGGLNKFNPETEKFTAYQKNDSTDLSGDLTTAILEDSFKNIWIGTNKGLNKLITSKNAKQPKKNKLIGISNGGEHFKVFDKKVITCLYEDSEKNIWVGTRANGLYRLTKETKIIEKFPINALHQNGGMINSISSITQLSENEMLVGTFGQGAFIFNIHEERFFKYHPETKEDTTGYNYVTQIKNTDDGCYVLTNRRIYKIIKNEVVTLWENHIVTAPTTFLIDNSGIIWIGSDGGGIVKLEPFRKKFNTFTKEIYAQNGFSISSIRAILMVNENLLVGGYTGLMELKNYHSDKSAVWKNITRFNGLNVYSMASDPIDKNVLWVGTEGSGLFKYNVKTGAYEKYTLSIDAGKYYFLSNWIHDILVCKNNDIYFATGGGTAKYDHKSKSFTNFVHNPDNPNTVNAGNVMALCEDNYGNIWMGTDKSGISIYNYKTNSFVRFESRGDKHDSPSLSNNRVNIIFEDSKKNIWVGTAGGLNKYSFENNNFTVYRTGNGMPNDCVYGILEDRAGFLWLSTNIGLSKFNPADGKFINYDYSYGLQSNEFNTAAYYKDSNGEMFFGGIKGFTSFYPDEIIQNYYAPPVIITNFKKFNQPTTLDKIISYVDKIELPYDDYFFSFDFVMPEYLNPLRQKFAYKLSGLDERWITLSNGERTAAFTGVQPGEYSLVVKGANSDGIWSANETRLKIIIHPAYWNTWWFRSLAAGFLVGILFVLYNSRVNRLKHEKEIQRDLTKKIINSQEEERKNISTELHDDLGQNLLVVKNRLMLADRDKTFEESLNDILEILDGSIQDVSNISHLLHPSELEELGLTQAIESMVYRIKSASNLKIINNLFSIDEYFFAGEKINVFRIIQEALNNVLKHAHAAEVILSCDVYKNKLNLSITDNGIGFINSNQQGEKTRPHIGLKGMKERALLLKGVLTVSSSPNKGTTIKLVFMNRIKT
jgi:signal transduction histidine kinase/ligand-binding sensor domain-containing protein